MYCVVVVYMLEGQAGSGHLAGCPNAQRRLVTCHARGVSLAPTLPSLGSKCDTERIICILDLTTMLLVFDTNETYISSATVYKR